MTSKNSMVEDDESPEKLREMFQEMKDSEDKDMMSRLSKMDAKFMMASDRLSMRNEITALMARKRFDRIEKVKLNKERLLMDFNYNSLNVYVQSN